jgi:hypothetical protein
MKQILKDTLVGTTILFASSMFLATVVVAIYAFFGK